MSETCWHDTRPYLYPVCTECGGSWTVVDSHERLGCRRCGINCAVTPVETPESGVRRG